MPDFNTKAPDAHDETPLTVSVTRACQLSGLGPTSIWSFLRDGRLEPVRLPGVRRTLISYPSLAALLNPASATPPRRRGRPRKIPRDIQAAPGAA